MSKFIINKSLVLAIILIFVGASVIPSITGNQKINVILNEEIQLSENSCDWPMFQHDPQHTERH